MGNNAQGFATLDEMIAACRRIPGLAKSAAPEVARAIDAKLREDLVAGRSPATGESWAEKKDGGRAYKAAAKALAYVLVGTTIVFTLRAPEVFGHFGARGRVRREMLPRGYLPFKLGDAIRKGLVPPFRKAVKGRR